MVKRLYTINNNRLKTNNDNTNANQTLSDTGLRDGRNGA